MDVETCPVCGCRSFRRVIAPSEVEAEFRVQRDFVLSRLPANPSPEELKDLTNFMHDASASLLRCTGCGLLTRVEPEPENAVSYEDDPNDPGVMAQLYPRYLHAFRNREQAYRGLLRPRADVVELGPHLGAFLQTAEEWDWRPTGVDIGSDTSAFVRGNGLKVIQGTLEDAGLRSGAYDAVFVWNCFEQLPDPMDTLRSIRSVLKPHGTLVVRVPNAIFYQRFRGSAKRVLAYNNLLGFPYLYGYSINTLNRLMARAGFEYLRGFNSELVTTPFADLTPKAEKEQRDVSAAVAKWSRKTSGPWIEAVYRMSSEPVIARPSRRLDPRFLARAVA